MPDLASSENSDRVAPRLDKKKVSCRLSRETNISKNIY